jgi:hypothetical protein
MPLDAHHTDYALPTVRSPVLETRHSRPSHSPWTLYGAALQMSGIRVVPSVVSKKVPAASRDKPGATGSDPAQSERRQTYIPGAEGVARALARSIPSPIISRNKKQ